ncbi:MAG: choice-of-anchor D domain-containing protein [Verrucomicrobia bacterium]|nr:choice-of-anchor D domain-containing protein [Verrucomicrobiota bacterium]
MTGTKNPFDIALTGTGSGTVTPAFPTPATVPVTSNGFTATGLTVGALTLGFDPPAGQVLTLVSNTSGTPIGGTFTHLAAGGTLATTHGGRSLLFRASFTGGDGNDLTLTLLAPEIAIEQPAGTDLAAGGSNSFGTVILGSPVSLVFTIRNTGAGILNGLTITKTGADQAAFDVTAAPTAPVSGPTGSTAFTVRFFPTTSGAKTAVLHLANDDSNENPFAITLTGRALATTDDTDGDGLNDAAEFQLAALGFDWQLSQSALVNTLMTNANLAGLYTQSQVQALNVGVPLLAKNPVTGKFKLTLGIAKSANLVEFYPFPLTAPDTTINPQGKLEFEFSVPDHAAFLRVEAE